MKNAQKYLEDNFPKKEKSIHIINEDLKGNLNLRDYSGLVYLILSCNEIDSLNLENLDNLKKIFAEYNKISSLDLTFQKNSLVLLNLTGNNFTGETLKDAISELSNLEYLMLKNNKKLEGSLENIVGSNSKLTWLDIEDTGLTYGIEHLPSSLKYFYPSKDLEEELSYYSGETSIERLKKWKASETTKILLERINQLKQLEHSSEIEKINSNWEGLIWLLKKTVNRYSNEKLNRHPIYLYPARTTHDSLPFGFGGGLNGYVTRHGKKVEDGFEYHFTLSRQRAAIIITMAHEIGHISVMWKEDTGQKDETGNILYPDQYHSPSFWKNYLGSQTIVDSNLELLKRTLSIDDWKQVEDNRNPLSVNFDSHSRFVYFSNNDFTAIYSKGLVTRKRKFSPSEEIEIEKEWNYIWQKLAVFFSESMNEGSEKEKKERWNKSKKWENNGEDYPEEQSKRAMSIRIKTRKENEEEGKDEGYEIGIIYNPTTMTLKLKKKVEEELEKWCNQPAKSTNLEKVKISDLDENEKKYWEEREQTIAQIVQINPSK